MCIRDRPPAERQSGDIAERHHPDNDGDCSDNGGASDFHQFLKTEIQSQGKKQEYDTDVGPDTDTFYVCNGCLLYTSGCNYPEKDGTGSRADSGNETLERVPEEKDGCYRNS